MIRNKGDLIRAVLSDQYTVFDNHQLVDLVAEAIGSMGIQPEIKRVAVGDELSSYILFPQVTVDHDPRANGEGSGNLHPAIHVSNSERGGGATKIVGAVFSKVCQNGLIYGWNAEDTLSIRHRYLSTEAMGYLVAQSVAAGLKMSEAATKAFVQSKEVHVPMVSLGNIVSDWAAKYGLTVSTKESWLGLICGEMNQNERPDDPRAFDIINGATLLAQQLDPIEAVTLERMAGGLLEAFSPAQIEQRQD